MIKMDDLDKNVHETLTAKLYEDFKVSEDGLCEMVRGYQSVGYYYKRTLMMVIDTSKKYIILNYDLDYEEHDTELFKKAKQYWYYFLDCGCERVCSLEHLELEELLKDLVQTYKKTKQENAKFLSNVYKLK